MAWGALWVFLELGSCLFLSCAGFLLGCSRVSLHAVVWLVGLVTYEPLSKLLVSPLVSPIVVPYIISYITPFTEFRLQLMY